MNPPAARRSPNYLTKVSAIIIWMIGVLLTFNFLLQVVIGLNTISILVLAIALQIVLTVAQSPIWMNRFPGMNISFRFFSVACLCIDALINFGGVLDIISRIDQAGSVQAIAVTFFGYAGVWPMWLKGIIAAFVSFVLAGLPEYLWKID